MFEKFRKNIAKGINWTANKINVDTDKLDLGDLKELYKMTVEFASGGDDGIIDAKDVETLLRKISDLIVFNKVSETQKVNQEAAKVLDSI